MNRKFYLQTWFICMMFSLSFLIIPAIVGIVLLIMQAILESKKKREFEEAIHKNAQIDDVNTYVLNKKNEAQVMIDLAKSETEKLKAEKDSLENELKNLRADLIIETINITKFDTITSEECKSQLEILKVKQDNLIKYGAAIRTDANSAQNKILENNKKQLLRCFNSECAHIFDRITIRNTSALKTKLRKSFETLNSIFKTDGVSITESFLKLKLEEFDLIYAYQLKKEQEREQERAIREQLIEEEKVRREIEKEKIKIEKEEQQFKNEIQKLMGYMSKVKDEIQIQLYVDKIKELEEKLKLLEKDKDNLLQREQNTRAGFVYIISNIGSFGENVYKIGMTRRLDPLDRIKELGDASVPFEFDVHALIFSEDAPALENILHQTFKDKQVNLINTRKEFFNIDLEEIKSVVLKNHNATVNFITVPEAYEYRESLRIRGEKSLCNTIQ